MLLHRSLTIICKLITILVVEEVDIPLFGREAKIVIDETHLSSFVRGLFHLTDRHHE